MSQASDPGELAAPLQRALAEFGRHLAAERGLSRHTVRAYLTDIRSLLGHAQRCGITGPSELDIGVLRSWLARQRAAGQARSSLARRGAAARTFTAFAQSRGWLARDPGPLLGTPKPHRTLPHVLRQDEISAVLDAAGAERAVVGGLSLGGYLSLAFFIGHPDRVAALMLFDTGPGFRKSEPRAGSRQGHRDGDGF